MVVDAPGAGPGWWAGGPSAVFDGETWWLAYRLRRPVDDGRGVANVVAASTDGVRFEPVCTLERDAFDTDSLERPALVRRPDGGWRLYVSCSTPGTKHWRVDAIDADTPAELRRRSAGHDPAGRRADGRQGPGRPRTVGTGAWRAWVCCHPLDVGGAEDRMVTRGGVEPRRADVGAGRRRPLGPTRVLGRAGRAGHDGRARRERGRSTTGGPAPRRTGRNEPVSRWPTAKGAG